MKLIKLIIIWVGIIIAVSVVIVIIYFLVYKSGEGKPPTKAKTDDLGKT